MINQVTCRNIKKIQRRKSKSYRKYLKIFRISILKILMIWLMKNKWNKIFRQYINKKIISPVPHQSMVTAPPLLLPQLLFVKLNKNILISLILSLLKKIQNKILNYNKNKLPIIQRLQISIQLKILLEIGVTRNRSGENY